MPARDDLMLSAEQKMYIELRSSFCNRHSAESEQLGAVGQQFIYTIERVRGVNYRQALHEGVAVWKNYLMSLEQMRPPLVSKAAFGAMIELFKVLPTKDHEYLDIGDFLGGMTQILASYQSMLKGEDFRPIFEEFMARMMDGLRYHTMPYLEETGVSAIEEGEELCPKSFLIYKYLGFLSSLITADMARRTSCASITRETLSRTSFMNWLVTLFHFFKNSLVMRKQILNLLLKIVTNFSISDHRIN